MMRPQKRKEIYYNPIQALFVLAPQLFKILIGGRGLGKSTVNGHESWENVTKMPRSRGLFLGLTYNQILTKTLPPILQHWEKLGLYRDHIRDNHYVIGKRPPKGWANPYMPPQKYDNVISFRNGSCIDLGSFDRKDHLRGGSYDWVMVDEAALISFDRYSTEILPSLRPSSILLSGKPRHLSETFTSSMPWLDSGMWLLEFGEKYKEQIKKQKQDPNFIPELFYIEGTSWHNRLVLTDKVIHKWKSTMPPLIYDVEVMNKKRKRSGLLFYPLLNERIHYYSDSFNYNYYDSLDFRFDSKLSVNSKGDADCDPLKPLNISLDFGGFNSMIVDQEQWPYVKTLKNFYVTHPKILDDMIDDFIKYYEYHLKKTVYLWGDKAGNKKEANSKTSLIEDVETRLRKAGWRVIRMKMGDIEHLERHRFFNILLKEEDHRLPKLRINQNNCKELIISMEGARMNSKNKKNKTGERNQKLAQEKQTHLTDCIDYRMYHGYIERLEGVGSLVRPYEIKIGG